jgi:hypothetical protein
MLEVGEIFMAFFVKYPAAELRDIQFSKILFSPLMGED